jgi:hypothetical protein
MRFNLYPILGLFIPWCAFAQSDVREPYSLKVPSTPSQSEGKVSTDEQRVHVLYARQDVTGADRQHAQNYEKVDVLRYSKGSRPLGIKFPELQWKGREPYVSKGSCEPGTALFCGLMSIAFWANLRA